MPDFALYPIEKVAPHPNNVRRVAKASPEMIDSVRSQGILEPVILGPEGPDGVRFLIAGNVRHHAAVEAGLTVLPAVLRDDLATEAQQVEAMLVENLHRTDLTAVEEADAYEQLQLFGMDVAAIAAATGRSKATVKNRLKLVDLPESARAKVHEGQATIADAEALLAFTDSPDVQAELTEMLGRKDFAWMVQNKRDALKRRTRNEKKIEEFKDLGAVEADPTDDCWHLSRFSDELLREASGHTHTECLGYRHHGIDSYSEPYLVCLSPASHDDEPGDGDGLTALQRQAEQSAKWAAQQEARAAQQEAKMAATKVRVDHIAGALEQLLSSHKTTAQHLAAATRAFLPSMLFNTMLEELVDDVLLDHALGLNTDTSTGSRWQVYQAARQERGAYLATDASHGEVLAALAGVLAVFLEQALSFNSDGLAPQDEDGPALQALAGIAWEWLTASGYQLSSVDEEIRDLAMYGTRDDVEDEDGEDR